MRKDSRLSYSGVLIVYKSLIKASSKERRELSPCPPPQPPIVTFSSETRILCGQMLTIALLVMFIYRLQKATVIGFI